MSTFNKCRSKVNALLISKDLPVYHKQRDKSFNHLCVHAIHYLDGSVPLKSNLGVADKAIRQQILRWIEFGGDLLQMLKDCIIEYKLSTQNRALKRSGFERIEHDEHRMVICNLPSEKFYSSKEWISLRYQILSKRGNKCECCGASPKDGVKIHVDHIKPRSIFPELALSTDNMQILCEKCNFGKSNSFTDDWRK